MEEKELREFAEKHGDFIVHGGRHIQLTSDLTRWKLLGEFGLRLHTTDTFHEMFQYIAGKIEEDCTCQSSHNGARLTEQKCQPCTDKESNDDQVPF